MFLLQMTACKNGHTNYEKIDIYKKCYILQMAAYKKGHTNYEK
jgi:hypothetical protein